MILLVVWSASGNGSALTSKVSLLNDDTYRIVCATVIVSSFGEIEQGAYYIGNSLIYLMRKAFLERTVVELVYKSDKGIYTSNT